MILILEVNMQLLHHLKPEWNNSEMIQNFIYLISQILSYKIVMKNLIDILSIHEFFYGLN